ncbi:hypothetical protein [Paenibacillus gallinarum]|uniref:ABM domain-containing protein n=1 Tax=Paenibacillus gallinarum TaxID=2762232 RepID=A0ABR8STF2_9BACL|nr:hypothetical protein [Paenibacillus gallinarum]MBD7966773.1 hypothetical protein [Paenibacillus gallinarum]
MFVKMYIYHVNLARIAEYEKIMERADKLYKRYVNYELFYMESEEEPGKFIEVQTYASEELYEIGHKLINKDPEFMDLYQSFEAVLAPNNKEIHEETLRDH